jgi:hypothetical protein
VAFPALLADKADVSVSYTTETLTGWTTAMEYAKYNYDAETNTYSLPAKPTWSALPATGSITSLIPAADKTSLKIVVRYKATSTAPAYGEVDVTIAPRPATPVKTNVYFDGLTSTIVATTGLQYVEGSAAFAADGDKVTGGAVSDIEPGASALTYKFRVAPSDGAGSEQFASAVFTVTVPARAAAPSPAYAAASDSITGVTVKMEWVSVKADEVAAGEPTSGWATYIADTPLTRANAKPNDNNGEAFTVFIRTAATSTAPASKYKAVEFPAAVAAPNLTTASIDYAAEKLTGTTTAMEYQKVGASTWTACAADMSITNLIPAAGDAAVNQQIIVRYKATSKLPASAATAVAIEIKPRQATPTAAQIAFDYITTEKLVLTGVTAGDYEYVIGTVSTSNAYKPLEVGNIGVTSSAQSVKIRLKATASEFASQPLTVSIAARAAAPSAVKWTASTKTISGLSTAMEYKIGEGVWTDVTTPTMKQEAGTALEAGGDIFIRVKATTAKPASAEKSINIPALSE